MATTFGLFYGSTEGATAAAAAVIKEEIEATGLAAVELHDVAFTDLKVMESYDFLILGISTWDIGQLQADWAYKFAELDKLDLTGKRVAIYGLGDQYAYPDSFVDAINTLSEKVMQRGAIPIGFSMVDDTYEFTFSEAVYKEVFIGLALDAENQDNLTRRRVRAWVQTVLEDIELPVPQPA